LTGKATVHAIAQIYGAEALDSGFIYVKGPEILNMYVGNTEKNIRELFWRGRKHYEKHHYPAIIFIDEAEAVLSERGTGRSSDVDKTIVPMFLSEMDGLTDSGVLVMLATNRPKMLDPAVVREGRVDRHVYIPRPDREACMEIFKIHLKGIPIDGLKGNKDARVEELAKRATGDVFSVNRKIYKVTDPGTKVESWFTFADGITGSMVEGIVDQATSLALKRDIASEGKTGIKPDEMRAAIQKTWQSYLSRNHKFDLEDYYERPGKSADGYFQRYGPGRTGTGQ
jgi:proteasome-associated ATPase